MSGFIKRKASIALWAAVAAVGSSYGEGRLHHLKTIEMLYRHWARQRAIVRTPPTMLHLYRFFRVRYGIEIEDPDKDWTLKSNEIEILFDTFARILLAHGIVQVET